MFYPGLSFVPSPTPRSIRRVLHALGVRQGEAEIGKCGWTEAVIQQVTKGYKIKQWYNKNPGVTKPSSDTTNNPGLQNHAVVQQVTRGYKIMQ